MKNEKGRENGRADTHMLKALGRVQIHVVKMDINCSSTCGGRQTVREGRGKGVRGVTIVDQ
jgi:hypothetical protein